MASPPRSSPPDPSGAPEERGPVVHALLRLCRTNRTIAGELLRPLGLYPGQELLLLQLAPDECCSQQQLVARMGLDHSTITKMLQRLERAGVVEREPSPADRRVVLVRLTGEGRRLRREVLQMWSQLEETTTGSLGPRQVQQLRRLLSLVEEGLERAHR